MNGIQVSSSVGLGNIPTTWTVVGTDDFNGDNLGDILWAQTEFGKHGRARRRRMSAHRSAKTSSFA
jgi:hypothetical protein